MLAPQQRERGTEPGEEEQKTVAPPTRMSVCFWGDVTYGWAKEYLTGTSRCGRCDRAHPFHKKYLEGYLTQMQRLAVNNEIVGPVRIFHEFAASDGSDSKDNDTQGRADLYFEFPRALTDDEMKKWRRITAGFYAGIKALASEH